MEMLLAKYMITKLDILTDEQFRTYCKEHEISLSSPTGCNIYNEWGNIIKGYGKIKIEDIPEIKF